jgi:hypothetical protein
MTRDIERRLQALEVKHRPCLGKLYFTPIGDLYYPLDSHIDYRYGIGDLEPPEGGKTAEELAELERQGYQVDYGIRIIFADEEHPVQPGEIRIKLEFP